MDDIARECREATELSWQFDQDNRREALEDLKFCAGFQWPDDARADRAGRPMVTINRTNQFVRQASNPIRRNMPAIKVEPIDSKSDPALAKIYNGLLRQIQYQSSASHIYAGAVEHAVSCGIGWWRVTSDYVAEDSWDQELLLKRIPSPLSVYPDAAAVEPDRSDMNWCTVTEMMPAKDFTRLYPKASTQSSAAPSDASAQSQLVWNTRDEVRLCEYWRRIKTPRRMLLLGNGQTIDAADQNAMQAVQMFGVTRERMVDGYQVESTLVTGEEQLEETRPWPGKWIPIIPVIGGEIPLERGFYRHGLIRFQREPQQLHNYFMSVAAETIGQAPKSPILATATQIKRYQELWKDAGKSALPYLIYDNDPQAPGPPQRLSAPEFPAAALNLAQVLADGMKATTGIYDAALGARSNETSGVAIHARERQGADSTLNYVDNLEHSLDHTGRIIVDLIPKIYDSQRTLRIVGDDDVEEYVQVNQPAFTQDGMPVIFNDISQARFDVRVTLGKSHATARRETSELLMQMMSAIPQAAPLIADLAVKNLDVPGAEQIANRLKTLLPPAVQQAENGQQPPPDPAQQEAMEIQRRKAMAETAETEAKAKKASAEADSATLDAQIKLFEWQTSQIQPSPPGNGLASEKSND